MKNEQLYFPGFQAVMASSVRGVRARIAVGGLSAERFTASLALALVCENLSFTTYALMVLVTSRGGSVTICDMVDVLNMSYHAIVHQVARAPYFERNMEEKRIRVKLNMDGERKMQRMTKRLAGRVER